MFLMIKRAGYSGWHPSVGDSSPAGFCVILFPLLHALSGHCRVWNRSLATARATDPTRCLRCVGAGQTFHSSSSRTEGECDFAIVGAEEYVSSNWKYVSKSLFVSTSLSGLFLGKIWKRIFGSRIHINRQPYLTGRASAAPPEYLLWLHTWVCLFRFWPWLKSRLQAVGTEH